MSKKVKVAKENKEKVGGKGGQERHSRHGSLTKAGKVRAQTLKVPRTGKDKKTIPRIRLRQKFLQVLDKPKSNRNREWEV